MKTGIIYMAVCELNNKLYIGQTTQSLERRKSCHKHEPRDFKFNYAIRKHGWENFKWIILCDNVPIKDLDRYEKFYIDLFNTQRNGYNSTEGGKGVGRGENHPNYGKRPWSYMKILPEDTKKKQSLALKGKPRSSKYQLKVPISGKHHWSNRITRNHGTAQFIDGLKLKKWRLEKELTVKGLAKILECGTSSIEAWEKESRGISLWFRESFKDKFQFDPVEKFKKE